METFPSSSQQLNNSKPTTSLNNSTQQLHSTTHFNNSTQQLQQNNSTQQLQQDNKHTLTRQEQSQLSSQSCEYEIHQDLGNVRSQIIRLSVVLVLGVNDRRYLRESSVIPASQKTGSVNRSTEFSRKHGTYYSHQAPVPREVP